MKICLLQYVLCIILLQFSFSILFILLLHKKKKNSLRLIKNAKIAKSDLIFFFFPNSYLIFYFVFAYFSPFLVLF